MLGRDVVEVRALELDREPMLAVGSPQAQHAVPRCVRALRRSREDPRLAHERERAKLHDVGGDRRHLRVNIIY